MPSWGGVWGLPGGDGLPAGGGLGTGGGSLSGGLGTLGRLACLARGRRTLHGRLFRRSVPSGGSRLVLGLLGGCLGVRGEGDELRPVVLGHSHLCLILGGRRGLLRGGGLWSGGRPVLLLAACPGEGAGSPAGWGVGDAGAGAGAFSWGGSCLGDWAGGIFFAGA